MSITNCGCSPLQMQKTCNINDTLMKSSWFYSATCLQQNKIRACWSNKIEVYKGRKILFTETLSCIYDTNKQSAISKNVVNKPLKKFTYAKIRAKIVKKGQISCYELPGFVQKYYQNILEGQRHVSQTSEILNCLVQLKIVF